MPKWNSFAPTSSQLSIISVATSPGYVTCSATSGFASSVVLSCLVTVGSTTDSLAISMSTGGAVIAAGTAISITVANAKAPPSLTSLTGLVFATYSSSSYLLDQSSGTTYSATAAATLLSSLVELTADTNTKINTQTSLTLRIQNSNPLPASSSMQIVIPSEFGVTLLTSITGSGSRIASSPTFSLSSDSRTVSISSFNTDYLEPLANIYITLSTLVNPSGTQATSSFQLTLLDSSNRKVETASSNILYTASPGSILSATVKSDIYYVNYNLSSYTFSFIPQDSFTSSAMVYIVFPDQINATNRASSLLSLATSSGSLSINAKASITVTQNKYALIKNLFSSDYSSTSLQTISLTIDKIANGQYINKTDSFTIYLVYASTSKVVLDNTIASTSSSITLTFQESPLLNYTITMDNFGTGYDGAMTVKVNTSGFGVTKGSFINLTIPGEFLIYNQTISEQGCTAISGFSDDITCSFTSISSKGSVLIVSGGFASADFNGSSLITFNISEIRNPFTSGLTSSFAMYIYDTYNQLQYYNNGTYQSVIFPAKFAYSMMTSSNPSPGQSCLYTLALTLSVDTPVGAYLSIILPSEISYDTDSTTLTCKGLNIYMDCYRKSTSEFQIQLLSLNRSQTVFGNGTTFSIQIGNLINPLSMQASSSFIVQTYVPSASQVPPISYINRESSTLQIQNTKGLTLYNLQISQTGSQALNAQTVLKWAFQSISAVPLKSIVSLTLDTSLVVSGTTFAILINSIAPQSISYNSASRSILFTTPIAIEARQIIEIVVSSGLYNPGSGPYSYSTFLISILSQAGFSIASVQSSEDWVKVSCSNNCGTCFNSLSNCSTCTQISGTEYYFSSFQCLSLCPSGQYGSAGVCQPCQYPCLECSHGPQLCTKCSPTYAKPYAYPLQLECFSTCPNGTYLDSSVSLCMKCETPCFTCSSSSLCESCDVVNKTNSLINFNSLDSQCYSVCPDGTYQTNQKQCLSCNSPCKTCTEEADQCKSCVAGFFQFGDQCLSVCPKNYKGNLDTMECDKFGELSFPVPFTILTILVTFLLVIANFMRNKTRFFITLMTMTDFILKMNWVILFISLGVDHSWAAFGIITYCLIANFLINFFLWRILFHKYQIDRDSELMKYSLKYKYTYHALLYLSFVVSFHLFRLTYSRILGMKRFSASFRSSQKYYTLMGRLTILSVLALLIPAVIANIIDLVQVKQESLSFYLDIDSLIIVVYLAAIITVVVLKREHVEKSLLDMGELIAKMGEDEDKDGEGRGDKEEKDRIEGAMDQMNRQSIIQRHFNDGSNKSEYESMKTYTQAFAKKMMGQVIRQYKSGSYNSGEQKDPNYFSKKSEFIDYNEFWKMKELLRQSELQLFVLSKQISVEEAKKQGLSGEFELIQTEYEGLLTQEEKLRQEIENLKSYLQDFEESTQKELQEQEQLRRDEIKHTVGMSKLKKVLTDVVLKQSQDIIEKGKKKSKRKGKASKFKPSNQGNNQNRKTTPEEKKDRSKSKEFRDNNDGISLSNQKGSRSGQKLNFHGNDPKKFKEELDLESTQIKEIEEVSRLGKKRGMSQIVKKGGDRDLSSNKPPLYNLQKDRDITSQQLSRQKTKSLGGNRNQLKGLKTSDNGANEISELQKIALEAHRPYTRDNEGADYEASWV